MIALVPSELHSPAQFAFEYATALVAAGWIAVCAFGLLRDHAAAWALFGVFTFGGRGVMSCSRSRPTDRAAGLWALVGLAVAAAALLAGRRERASPGGRPQSEGYGDEDGRGALLGPITTALAGLST